MHTATVAIVGGKTARAWEQVAYLAGAKEVREGVVCGIWDAKGNGGKGAWTVRRTQGGGVHVLDALATAQGHYGSVVVHEPADIAGDAAGLRKELARRLREQADAMEAQPPAARPKA